MHNRKIKFAISLQMEKEPMVERTGWHEEWEASKIKWVESTEFQQSHSHFFCHISSFITATKSCRMNKRNRVLCIYHMPRN